MPPNDFVEYVVQDLLHGLEGVEAKAMFGEYSLYLDGKMFALVSGDVLYFKVGDSNRAKYKKLGSQQYTYIGKGGKEVPMPYWEVPVDILEDREKLAKWAEESSRIQLPSSDPLHGVTLQAMLEKLVEYYGWENLGERIRIRCFILDPSIKSSLTFLRKTPWARLKVENLYLGLPELSE